MNRNNDKKNGFLPVLLGILTACAVIIALAVFNMDAIMLRFSPKIYISSLAAKTVKELNTENSKKDEVYPKYRSLLESNTLKLDGTFKDKAVSFTSNYSAQTPQIYASGEYDGIAFDGYIREDETGICLPKLMDVYFTLPTKSFGEEYNKSLAASFLPFRLSDKLSLSMDILQKQDTVSAEKIYKAAAPLLDNISVKKGSEPGEILITIPSDKFKESAKGITSLYKDTFGQSGISAVISRICGVNLSDSLFDVIISELDGLDTSDSVTISCIQRKSHIVKLHTKINIKGGGGIDILADSSSGVRMLDDMLFKLSYETDSSKIGISYECSGNFFYDNEDLYSEKSFTFDFGNSRLISLSHSEHGNKQNRNGGLEISCDTLGAASVSLKYSSVLNSDSDSISLSQLMLNGANILSADINVSDYEQVQIPSKQTYPLNELDAQDLPLLMNVLKEKK